MGNAIQTEPFKYAFLSKERQKRLKCKINGYKVKSLKYSNISNEHTTTNKLMLHNIYTKKVNHV